MCPRQENKFHLSSTQSQSLSDVRTLLQSEHSLCSCSYDSMKVPWTKFSAGLARDHEHHRHRACHRVTSLPEQPWQICAGFKALTASTTLYKLPSIVRYLSAM